MEWASCLPDRSPGELPRLVVAVDELRGLLALEGPDKPITELLVRAFSQVCRAKGITFVVASQTPRDCADVIANAAVKIAFRSDYADDTETISSAFGLEEYQRQLLGTLRNYHAVAKFEGEQATSIVTDAFSGSTATAHYASCVLCRARVACRRIRPMAEEAVRGMDASSVARMCGDARSMGASPTRLASLRRVVSCSTCVMPLEAVDCAVGLALELGGVSFDEARSHLIRYGRGE